MQHLPPLKPPAQKGTLRDLSFLLRSSVYVLPIREEVNTYRGIRAELLALSPASKPRRASRAKGSRAKSGAAPKRSPRSKAKDAVA